VLKRLISCSYSASAVRGYLDFSPSDGSSSRRIIWEHDAPGIVSESWRWSTTRPQADIAGWTEVVIPRGPQVLIDLPVGRPEANLTSISLWWGATYPGGNTDSYGGTPAAESGTNPRGCQFSEYLCPEVSARSRVGNPELSRIGCPNNYEVTL
jgi:hypothetical protein